MRSMLVIIDRDEAIEKKIKYPKKMAYLKDRSVIKDFDESKFYWTNFERPHRTSTYFYLSITVFIIFGACLFPIWPLSVKLGVWWFLFGLTLFLVIEIFIIDFFNGFTSGYICCLLYLWI
jgi:translocation protein SEC62